MEHLEGECPCKTLSSVKLRSSLCPEGETVTDIPYSKPMKTLRRIRILHVPCWLFILMSVNIPLCNGSVPEVQEYNYGPIRENIREEATGIHKVKDLVIYSDTQFYSSFPSVIRSSGGEYIVAFRRAPDRKIFG